MSVCFETSGVLANPVSSASSVPSSKLPTEPTAANVAQPNEGAACKQQVAKLVLPSHGAGVLNPPVITVLNPSGPLTVVKTLCVTSAVSSAPQFTLVNSTPLNVASAVGKTPTITLLNAPVTVVKAITTQGVEKAHEPLQNNLAVVGNASPVPAIVENRGHNVFVKNTYADSSVPEMMSQSHKLLTASNFPQSNVLTSINSAATKTANGQRGKLKILSNVVMPGTSQAANANILLNKTNAQKYTPRPKMAGPNGANKYVGRPPCSIAQNSGPRGQPRTVYPTHKGQVRTMPPAGYAAVRPAHTGIKTIPPKSAQNVQRTGLKTIPPQRPQKPANKPNYIGKHAVQAQKMRQTKAKGAKVQNATQGFNNHGFPMPSDMQITEMTFNQALTAQIIETLSNNSATPAAPSGRYEILPARYESAFSCPEVKQPMESPKQIEDKTKSGLDALSLICQAVLLDHNYNATLPPESPTRSNPATNAQSQLNGVSGNSMYSPVAKRRTLSSSNSVSGAAAALTSSPANSTVKISVPDDDAASDISDGSDRKHDTEGEETDTAPEAEAVNNDEHFDGYGDYVTRCICGFLHDDGYMVECDRCKVWQHVQCVVKNRQVPDEYLCEVCDVTKPIDRQKARALQQQWLKDRQFADPKLKKDAKAKEMFKPKETVSDTDSSDGEQIAHNNNVIVKGRTLASRRKAENLAKQNNVRQKKESVKEVQVQRRQKRRERKIVKRKLNKLQPKTSSSAANAKSHSDDENVDSWSQHLPQLRQWIEKYEEAVTNHYSPELRARISSIRVNGAAHQDPNDARFDSSVHKCRVHTQPLTELRYLVSTAHLAPNTAVVELRGKYMLSAQHRNPGASLTTRQHSQRPGPFLFFYRLHKDNTEVCVDTRTYGNSARFVRRSCKPNAELRHCIEKGVLHLYIVSITEVEKNAELTIKHESHDLAAIGTTRIACACGNVETCTVNRTSVKKNGETNEIHRKRRGRRTISSSVNQEPEPAKIVKEEPPAIPVPPIPQPSALSPVIKQEKEKMEQAKMKTEPVELKIEVKDLKTKTFKDEDKDSSLNVEVNLKDVKVEDLDEKMVEVKKEKDEDDDEDEEEENEKALDVKNEKKEDEAKKSPSSTPIGTRRSSYHRSDKEDEKSEGGGRGREVKEKKSKKLSREERKLEAILRAIEQMEKAESRKQENQAKQAHRRESEPGVGCGVSSSANSANNSFSKESEDKQEVSGRLKRRRRKGRARTTSQNARRNRLNSTDSYLTSGDENLLSPTDNNPLSTLRNVKETAVEQTDNKAVGLLLALSNGDSNNTVTKHEKSPSRDVIDSNSNSAHSSPETQLSSACLLVQAAVEPLEPGFKFPKTKKGLMNEWLNKAPEPVQSASLISPSSLTPHLAGSGSGLNLNLSSGSNSNVAEFEGSGFYSPAKNLAALAQAASFCDAATVQQPRGSAKKRWLRQAISEDHSSDSVNNRPESPPINDMVAPPKKRRLPRESLSTDTTPPTTPTCTVAPLLINKNPKDRPNCEGCVEIVYSGTDGDSPNESLESDAILKERAAKMKQEFSKCIVPSTTNTLRLESPRREQQASTSCLMDPRLSRDRDCHSIFSNSDLVGTVEKTLSILGFESSKSESSIPKRKVKLSITEYRQRKKLTSDKNDDQEQDNDVVSNEENNSSESFKVSARPRSDSTSSDTSLTSSEDGVLMPEMSVKAPAFNSEPTELERQREISSLRLKKAFGLAVDEDTRPALNVEAILNSTILELEPKVKPIPLPSPTFPIPGSCDLTVKELALNSLVLSSEPVESVVASPVEATEETGGMEDSALTDDPMENEEKEEEDDAQQNIFYTPDEDEEGVAAKKVKKEEVQSEDVESISYVPPFNNPVYPNSNFTNYTSTIDDEARYEGRNPSPPPDLKGASGSTQS